MKLRRVETTSMTMRKHDGKNGVSAARSEQNSERQVPFAYARSRVSNAAVHDRAPRAAVHTRIGIVSHPYHRDPSHWASIRTQMKSALAQYGGRGTEAVTLLAADTDRLFARVARDHGMRLSAVIPCKNFENFFATPDDLSEYVYLRALAQSRTVLDHATFNATSFETASKFIVDTCNVLVAIGNGKKALPNVGTGNIVQYAIERGKLLVWLDPDAPVMESGLHLVR